MANFNLPLDPTVLSTVLAQNSGTLNGSTVSGTLYTYAPVGVNTFVSVANTNITGTMISNQIANNNIGSAQLANNSVGSAQLANNSVGSAQLATGRILTGANLPANSVIQLISAPFLSVFSTGAGAWVDVTGFSATIKPTLSNNKVLVIVNLQFGMSVAGDCYVRLLRNGTNVDYGRDGNFGHSAGQANFSATGASICFLDNPASSSTVTYQIQLYGAGGNMYNARGLNNYNDQTTSSDITLMEISQ